MPPPIKAPRQPHMLCIITGRRGRRRAPIRRVFIKSWPIFWAARVGRASVIGRVIDRVADAGEREHGHQQPIGMDEAGEREGDAAQQDRGDQWTAMRAPSQSTRKPAGV